MNNFRRRMSSEEAPSINYLTFTALESGTFTLQLNASTTNYKYVMYSLNNGATWTKVDNTGVSVTITTPTVSAGDTVLWKGNGYRMMNTSSGATPSSFSSTCKFNASGNIMSLLKEDECDISPDITKDTTFVQLFKDCTTIITAPELPSTVALESCYYGMFMGCTSLIKAPDLPATTAYYRSYMEMFSGCTSLTIIPTVLPAETNTADRVYQSMFYNCTSITAAPEIKTSTIGANLCLNMFTGCTSLISTPKLVATSIANYGCKEMFKGCTSLSVVPSNMISSATSLGDQSCMDMFSSCSSITTTFLLPCTSLGPECYRNMFLYCVGITTAPELPATTLTYGCYRAMLSNTSIDKIVLPATTLTTYCYYYMCQGCTNLKYVKMLAINTTPNNCIKGWMESVPRHGIFIKNINATWTTIGDSGVQKAWFVEYEDPQHITLPTGYTQLGYIRSDASNQYIDLNIKLYEVLDRWYDIATEIAMPHSTSYNGMVLFCCQDYNTGAGTNITCGTLLSNNKRIISGKYIGANQSGYKLGRGDDLQVDLPVLTPPDKNVYNLNNLGLTHNYGTSLFCRFVNEDKTSVDAYSIISLRYFKLFIEGVLVRDMVPCRNPNNVVGLYDTVNDVFYSSPNGAAFIAGPEI